MYDAHIEGMTSVWLSYHLYIYNLLLIHLQLTFNIKGTAGVQTELEMGTERLQMFVSHGNNILYSRNCEEPIAKINNWHLKR